LLGLKYKYKKEVLVDTYECGVETYGSSWFRFNVSFYLYALLFVIFDIETVFLYPWAVSFKALGMFGFMEMIVFILILLVGLAYAWKKEALKWE
jgi:NADH-quinone oxidoreductase subunit A